MRTAISLDVKKKRQKNDRITRKAESTVLWYPCAWAGSKLLQYNVKMELNIMLNEKLKKRFQKACDQIIRRIQPLKKDKVAGVIVERPELPEDDVFKKIKRWIRNVRRRL